MRVFAGDIGGTKTRLALLEVTNHRITSHREETYPSRHYSSLETLVSEFIAGVEPGSFEAAGFGVAGPVRNGRCEVTNLPWVISAEQLARHLSLPRVSLLNDLEATGWGIQALSPEDFRVLNPGSPDAAGNASVIAAGTGLGEAGMYWDGQRHWPFASEGGHTQFSASDELEFALLRFLQRRYQHVSWERILSGPGLQNLYEFLLEFRNTETPQWLREQMRSTDRSAAISRAGLEGTDPICVEVLDLFARLYGAEAGNHALKTMATAGVYVAGGIAPKILPKLEQGWFMQGFTEKGRMAHLLNEMPVKVVLNERTALFGPAVYANDLTAR